jgi:uncharacterized protein
MDQNEVIERVLRHTRRVAVVGLSPDPWRTSHGIANVLLSRGYEVVPVNPNVDEVLGERAYPRLTDVPGTIDLVDVFRRPDHLVDVTRDTVEAGAPALWFQSGLRSEEARTIAEDAGIDLVQDRCLMVEISRYDGTLDLPPAS